MNRPRSIESGIESTFRDGSPDKIASQNMSREANGFNRSFTLAATFAPASLSALSNKFDFLADKPATAGENALAMPQEARQTEAIKEFSELTEKGEPGDDAKGMTYRDKVSFVSAAFCNPLFLVGMGAAMAVLDELREQREARMDDALMGKIHGDAINSRRRQADDDRQQQAIKLKEETEEQKKKRLLLEATGLLGSGDRGALSGAFGENAVRESILKNGLRKQQQKKEMRGRMREKLLSGVSKGFDERAAQRSVINWLKTNKLIKYKMKLENQMEKSRGKEGLAFVSSLASKIERIDKVLKRSAN